MRQSNKKVIKVKWNLNERTQVLNLAQIKFIFIASTGRAAMAAAAAAA
jgi:hypothetical protein